MTGEAAAKELNGKNKIEADRLTILGVRVLSYEALSQTRLSAPSALRIIKRGPAWGDAPGLGFGHSEFCAGNSVRSSAAR